MEIETSYQYCPYCGKSVLDDKFSSIPSKKINNNEKRAIYKESVNKEKLEKIIKIHPNAYKIWEKEEEEKLISLFEDGKSFDEISKILQRQPNAIRIRLKKLGVLES